MFGFKNQHRADLLEAQEKTLKAQKMVIDVLAEQVEWLRWQLSEKAHRMAPSVPGLGPEGDFNTFWPEEDTGRKGYLSEEEEDLLALRLNDHLSDLDVAEISKELGLDIRTDD